MRLLTVPNWSFGRDKRLLQDFRSILTNHMVILHYCESDVDHNRTVTAFSGEPEVLLETLRELCARAFQVIDLNRHVGVHPRIGALDVCPFVLVPGEESDVAKEAAHYCAEEIAEYLADEFEIPVFLYEKSERGRHEADLPTLRKGGFGSLAGKELNPDFGPRFSHTHLGVSVVGFRDFLIAMNVNLASQEVSFAKQIAKAMRYKRQEGDSRFLGVRAIGIPLASRELTQVSVNLTLADITHPDAIIEWVSERASERGILVAGTELVGVIRKQDLAGATRLPICEEQIVDNERF